ncbi:MAG: Nicotinamide-nucleotide amidohydrolase PncC [Planctomycetes bacterium]|nr:Nicotinamide-nucleotide amidohydrolase PncC [Planctomycetota bacterium]
MATARILSTGDELVRGRSLDTNTSEIARALSGEGVSCEGAEVVADDLPALVDAIRRACATADFVVLSGGLGPTEDDCTRAAAAAAAGVAIERVPELAAALEERFARRGIPMPPSNLLQADRPAGAETLPNRHGTAPGFAMAIGRGRFLALPGPPNEMRGVLAEEALPRIRAFLAAAGGPRRVVRTRSLETWGEREAAVGEKIADLMRRGRMPRVGTTAARGTIRILVHAEGDPADVDALLASDEAEIRRRLGPAVFGADGETIEDVAARALLASGRTLAVAESCTGGMIGALLTGTPGISASFLGGVIAYANEAKVRDLGVDAALLARVGAVSEEVARAMASGVRARTGADIGIGITGVAGPGGGSEEKPVGSVHLALDDRGAVTHRRLALPGDRALVREIAAKSALDLLRRSLGR